MRSMNRLVTKPELHAIVGPDGVNGDILADKMGDEQDPREELFRRNAGPWVDHMRTAAEQVVGEGASLREPKMVSLSDESRLTAMPIVSADGKRHGVVVRWHPQHNEMLPWSAAFGPKAYLEWLDSFPESEREPVTVLRRAFAVALRRTGLGRGGAKKVMKLALRGNAAEHATMPDGILADYLEDVDDPRHELVRAGARTYNEVAQQNGVPWAFELPRFNNLRHYDYDVPHRQRLPDGSEISVAHGHPKDMPDGTHRFVIGWHFPGTAPYRAGYYKMFTGPEAVRWINRLPDEHRAIRTNLKRAIVYYVRRHVAIGGKAKFARMKAPAGGAITNNQFIPGGQFLPRALGRIRDVVAKARAKKLARDLPGSNIVPFHAFTQPTLTLHQLKSVEDTFGVPEEEKLSNAPSFRVSADGSRIESNDNDRWTVLENLTRRRLSGDTLGRKILDGSIDPDEKMVYLVSHLAHDARLHRGNGAKEWYGTHLNVLDRALHELFGKGSPHWGTVDKATNRVKQENAPWVDSPGITLAKAVIALTSGNQNPRDNVNAALRMLEHGRQRSRGATDHRMFTAVPKANFPALSEWLAKAAALHPDKTAADLETVGDPVEYWRRVIAPFQDELTPRTSGSRQAGFKGQKIAVDKATGEPIGVFEGYGHKMRLINLQTREPMQWDARTMKDGLMPVAKGGINRLIPKGWSNRGKQVADGLEAVQTLVAKKGMSEAAKWLLTPHRAEEFKDTFGKVSQSIKDAFNIYGEDKLPGAFVLGPKFGTFFLNLHANDKSRAKEFGKYLTADLWWTRQWQLYLGQLFAAVKGKREPIKAPTTVTERRAMFKAAQHAAKLAGLKSVSQLQAVLWFYTQHLSRLFGGDTPSYSFVDGVRSRFPNAEALPGGKVKLSRAEQLAESVLWRISQLADRMALSGRIPPPQVLIDALVAAMRAAGEPAVKLSRRVLERHETVPLVYLPGILADKMGDEGDPREVIVRNGLYTRGQGNTLNISPLLRESAEASGLLGTSDIRVRNTGTGFGRHSEGEVPFGDGTAINIQHVHVPLSPAAQERRAKEPGPVNHAFILSIVPEYHRLSEGSDPLMPDTFRHTKSFTIRQLADWLKTFPEEHRDKARAIGRIAAQAVRWYEGERGRVTTTRTRLARQKRDGVSFVSSSTRVGSKIEDALVGLHSEPFKKLEEETPGGKSGLGFWEDGAEESRIVPTGNPEKATELGRRFGQRAILSFRFDKAGPHVLHVLHVPSADPVSIHATLRDQGAPYATVVPSDNMTGSTVFVADADGSQADPVRAAAVLLNAKHRAVRGESILRELRDEARATKLARPAEFVRPMENLPKHAIPGTQLGVNEPRKVGDWFVKFPTAAGSPYAEEAAAKGLEHLGLPTLRPRRVQDEHGRQLLFSKYVPGIAGSPLNQGRSFDPKQVAHALLADYMVADADRNPDNYVMHPQHGLVTIDHGRAFHPQNAYWGMREHPRHGTIVRDATLTGGPHAALHAATHPADSALYRLLGRKADDAEVDPHVLAKAISPAHERHWMRLAWEGTEDLPKAERLAAVRAMRHRIRTLRTVARENGGRVLVKHLADAAFRARDSYKPDPFASM